MMCAFNAIGLVIVASTFALLVIWLVIMFWAVRNGIQRIEREKNDE